MSDSPAPLTRVVDLARVVATIALAFGSISVVFLVIVLAGTEVEWSVYTGCRFLVLALIVLVTADAALALDPGGAERLADLVPRRVPRPDTVGAMLVTIGLFVIAGLLLDELGGVYDVDGLTRTVPVAAALVGFAGIVSAASWWLRARVAVGLTVGALTVATFEQVATAQALTNSTDAMQYSHRAGPPPVDAQSAIILGLAVLLVLGWTWCALVTGHLGYRILVIAMALTVLPSLVLAMTYDSADWWTPAVGTGAVLVVLALRGRHLATT